MYYRVCPICHAHLDPGEKCDCVEERNRKNEEMMKMLFTDKSGQIRLIGSKEEK